VRLHRKTSGQTNVITRCSHERTFLWTQRWLPQQHFGAKNKISRPFSCILKGNWTHDKVVWTVVVVVVEDRGEGRGGWRVQELKGEGFQGENSYFSILRNLKRFAFWPWFASSHKQFRVCTKASVIISPTVLSLVWVLSSVLRCYHGVITRCCDNTVTTAQGRSWLQLQLFPVLGTNIWALVLLFFDINSKTHFSLGKHINSFQKPSNSFRITSKRIWVSFKRNNPVKIINWFRLEKNGWTREKDNNNHHTKVPILFFKPTRPKNDQESCLGMGIFPVVKDTKPTPQETKWCTWTHDPPFATKATNVISWIKISPRG